MKAFQKIRATLEPTLDENQKKAPESALTTHTLQLSDGEQAMEEGGGEPESSGDGTASACRAVQNPLEQPRSVHGAMSSRRNTFTL